MSPDPTAEVCFRHNFKFYVPTCREGGEYSFGFYTEQKTVHVALGNHPIPKMGAERRVN